MDYPNIEEMIQGFFKTLPCQCDIFMPELKVEKKNLEYANLLSYAYVGSSDSEMQAISQYIHHSKTIEDKNISNALKCISLIEMSHLDTLGQLIELLGGKPFFNDSNFDFWIKENIANLDGFSLNSNEEGIETQYAKNSVRCKIQKDINGELNGINSYKFILRNIKDKYIEKIIYKIILDEQLHLKLLGEFLKDENNS